MNLLFFSVHRSEDSSPPPLPPAAIPFRSDTHLERTSSGWEKAALTEFCRTILAVVEVEGFVDERRVKRRRIQARGSSVPCCADISVKTEPPAVAATRAEKRKCPTECVVVVRNDMSDRVRVL